MATQRDLLPIAHLSLHPKRLRRSEYVSAERIYARAWRKENRESDLLGYILAPEDPETGYIGGPAAYSRRDAAVAASVVQWLGTNVGQCFVERLQRQVSLLRDEQVNDVQRRRWWWRFEQLNAPFRPTRLQILKAQVAATRERLKRIGQERMR